MLPSTATMYKALVRRDAAYDGTFFVAVKTTGVFCRPVCWARKPKPQNVEYYATTDEARRAGYRACAKCRPLDDAGALPAWAKTLLERIERAPERRIRDAELTGLGLEPARVRRWFQSRFHLTFQGYHRARRLRLALDALKRGDAIAGAAFGSGYESLSGFRDAFRRLVGDAPGRGRATTCLYAERLDTPLGPMLALALDEGVCLLEFMDRPALERELRTLAKRYRAPLLPGTNAPLETLRRELADYFAGKSATFTVPLVQHGSDFLKSVWKRLRAIPPGTTTSYAALAKSLGRPGAQRAVARANGANPIAIVVPCHRVIGSDGALRGYGGGLARKRWLIDHEARWT